MSYHTYGAVTSSTAKMPTLEDVKRMMDECERRWPRSERCIALDMPPTTEDALSVAANGSVFPVRLSRRGPFDTLFGLPIRTRLDVPAYCWIEAMADGSEVMHYRSGFTVRCVAPASPPQKGRD